MCAGVFSFPVCTLFMEDAPPLKLSDVLHILLFDKEQAKMLKPRHSLPIAATHKLWKSRDPRDQGRRQHLMWVLLSGMIANDGGHEHGSSSGLPPAFCVSRRPLPAEKWKRVFFRIQNTCPILSFEALTRLTAFVSEGLPAAILEDYTWNCFELASWHEHLTKDRMNYTQDRGWLPLPSDVCFCGSTWCEHSMAVELMLDAFQDKGGPSVETVLVAAHVYILALQRCGTAGNLHTAGLLRVALVESWGVLSPALRAAVADADMILMFKVGSCSNAPSWRLWDLLLAQLTVGAVASTCGSLELISMVVITAEQLGPTLEKTTPVRSYILDAVRGLLPVPTQSLCTLTSVLQATEAFVKAKRAVGLPGFGIADLVAAASRVFNMCSANGHLRMTCCPASVRGRQVLLASDERDCGT